MRPHTAEFKRVVWDYYKKRKRDFPWRRRRNPYKVLVSEIMLQQTQVGRVVEKYKEFFKKFPNLQSLAQARVGDVLTAWQGLGYNRRALMLKKLSEIVAVQYGGELPQDFEKLIELPGIGPSTAGGVMAFAFNKPVVFIETNIRRAYIHFFFKNAEKVHDKKLIPLIEATLDRKNPREWYWALMDYGAMLGTLEHNPNKRSAHYALQSKFKGSNREVRGSILKFLIAKKRVNVE